MYKEKGNKFVMFHAVQSAIYGVAIFVLFMGFGIVSMLLTALSSGLLGCIMLPISLLLAAVFFCSWIFLMYKAYNGEKFKIPVIGDLAEKHAG
jgi:uncharacterized membrane protein